MATPRRALHHTNLRLTPRLIIGLGNYWRRIDTFNDFLALLVPGVRTGGSSGVASLRCAAR